MTSRSLAVALVALAAGSGLLAPACLLGDYTVGATSDSGVDSATPGDGSTLPDGARSDGSTLPDGASTCAPFTGDCDGVPSNGCETDLRISAQHCGVCNRGCGAVQCQQGECQSERLISGLVEPFGLEVAGARLVWHQPGEIRGCRADDCAVSKAVLADVTGSSPPLESFSPRQIAVIGQNLYFSQCPPNSNTDCGIAACDLGGCKALGASYVTNLNQDHRALFVVASPGAVFGWHPLDGFRRTDPVARTVTGVSTAYKISEGLQAFHVDAQHALWLDSDSSQANPTGGLFACAPAGCPGAALRLLPPPVRHLAADKGIAYTSTGGAGAGAGSLIACDANGCGGAGKVLAKDQRFISDIAVEGPFVYWTTLGVQDPKTNGMLIGTLMRCALPDCAGGPKKLADGLLNPTSVRVEGSFVYWLERGATGQSNGRISRLRR